MARTILVIVGLGAVIAAVVVIAVVSTKKSGEEIMTEVTPTMEVAASPSLMPLMVSSPVDGAQLTGMSVVVKGQTTPAADVAINQLDVKADSKGNFSAMISLDEGENVITVIANDDIGNYAEKNITVTVTGSAQ